MSTAVATLDEAIECGWSPIDLMRNIRDAARARLKRATYDQAVVTMDSLIAYIEAETRDAFARAAPGDVENVAAALAPKHWELAHAALSISMRIAETVGISCKDALKDPVEHWSEVARNAHELLPSLGPEARMRVRATAFLFSYLAATPETRKAIAEHCREDPTWPYCDRPDEGVAEFSVLHEAIWIGGTTDLFGRERNDAIARALWRSAHDGVDEQAVEDAWDRAAMAESMLDDGELSWEDAKASLPN